MLSYSMLNALYHWKCVCIILVQRNNSKNNFIWKLGPCLFRDIGLSNSQMQFSIMILVIEFGMSIVQIPSVIIIDLELVAILFIYLFMQDMVMYVHKYQHGAL